LTKIAPQNESKKKDVKMGIINMKYRMSPVTNKP